MATTEMSMIETAFSDVIWVCLECGGKIKDKKNIEKKLKSCPFCNAEITAFHYLYDDEGNDGYVE